MKLISPSRLRLSFLLSLAIAGTDLCAQNNPDWTAPQTPFRIADNLYYVGSRDLAAFLFTSPDGNILLNANLESSPPQIRRSVEMLGHRWRDTKILLNGQAHFDHAAGTAQIVRETGAKVMVMEGDADVIESGGKADFAHLPEFPPAHVDRVLHDGDTVAFGGVTLKAIKTAGHTRGCTTWVTDVRDTAGRKRSVVIVGGLTALDTYRLIPSRAGNESYPGIAADFQHTFQTLNALRPDIFLGAHGSYFGMQKKLAERRDDNDTSVWIDPVGFHRAVEEAWRDFEKHLRSEQRADTTRMSRH